MPPETWPGVETTGLTAVESSIPCLPGWLSTFMDGQKANTALYFLAVSTMPSGPKETHIPSRDEWCKAVKVNMPGPAPPNVKYPVKKQSYKESFII